MKVINPKKGVNLQDVEGFARYAKKLRELWITTAGEFVGICEATGGKEHVAEYLSVDSGKLDTLLKQASARIQRPAAETRRSIAAAIKRIPGMGLVEPSKAQLKAHLAKAPYLTVRFPAAQARTLPASVDWRSMLLPIRDQGRRPTCVAFSYVAMREFLEAQAGGEARLSEQLLYWDCKQKDGQPTCGARLDTGAQCLLDDGVCRGSFWKYETNPTPCPDMHGPPPANALSEAEKYKIERIITLNPRSVPDIKTCLADGKVVIFGIPVYGSWYESAAVWQYGNITMRVNWEPLRGGHAMCFVGYQDDPSVPGGGFFILRNSWGTGWAYDSPYGAGYGTIPYQYISDLNSGAFSADRRSDADVYIRDNPQDTGTVPSSHWCFSPDIWVRLKPDGGTTHQNPELGQLNHVYVRVHNKGPAVAYNVTVNVYYAGFSPSLYPHNWVPIDTLTVNGIDAGGSKVVGPFMWTPPQTGHTCLFVRLWSDDDPISHDYSPQWDNNVAQKNVDIFDLLPDSTQESGFRLNGVDGASSVGELLFDRSKLPKDAGIMFWMPNRLLGEAKTEGFRKTGKTSRQTIIKLMKDDARISNLLLKSNDSLFVKVSVKAPVQYGPGKAREHPVVITQKTGELVVGKITLMVREVKKPVFIGNSNPKCREVHRPDCVWVEKMLGRHKVPFDSLDEAHTRGYDNCYYCIGGSER
jgi:hypothetical protein